MPLLLGIDIGTSSAKAVLFDADRAQVLASAGQEYPVNKPTPDRAEQNPDDWWQSTVACVRQVVAQSQQTNIAGISFSGQMHGTVFLNDRGEPLHPAIIWPDQRSKDYLQPLVQAGGGDAFVNLTGTLPAVGFMGPTLLWMQAHAPDILDQTHRVLLPKDYVRFKMTGKMTTEPSDAAGTALFDIHQGTWLTSLINKLELPAAIFPDVQPSAAVVGELTTEAAEALGLREGILVVSGAADQPAQALGNGIIAYGNVSVTLGSGGQVFAPQQTGAVRTRPQVHVFNHAVPDTLYTLGAMLSAGLSLRWLRDLFHTDYATLSVEAETIPAGCDGLLFMPYLSGERTPHMDPSARGAFIGLTSYHTRGHMARAVMEGVAYALRQTLTVSVGSLDNLSEIIGSGGGIENPLWRSMLTDVTGLPLRKSLQAEQASVGAAALAGIGVGVYTSFDNLRDRVAAYDTATDPNTALQPVYEDRYQQFVELYPRLREDFQRLSG